MCWSVAADQLAQGGRTQEASALAGRALALDQTSERALGASLRCLSLLGDRSGALELYERFAARVKEEVGTDAGRGDSRAGGPDPSRA